MLPQSLCTSLQQGLLADMLQEGGLEGPASSVPSLSVGKHDGEHKTQVHLRVCNLLCWHHRAEGPRLSVCSITPQETQAVLQVVWGRKGLLYLDLACGILHTLMWGSLACNIQHSRTSAQGAPLNTFGASKEAQCQESCANR